MPPRVSERCGRSCSAEIVRSRSAGDAALDDAPNTVASSVAGAVYIGSAWVRAPSGRTVTLRLRERRGTTTVRTTAASATGTGGWLRLAVTTPPASGATSLSLEVVVSLAKNGRAQIDDVSLQRG